MPTAAPRSARSKSPQEPTAPAAERRGTAAGCLHALWAVRGTQLRTAPSAPCRAKTTLFIFAESLPSEWVEKLSSCPLPCFWKMLSGCLWGTSGRLPLLSKHCHTQHSLASSSSGRRNLLALFAFFFFFLKSYRSFLEISGTKNTPSSKRGT